MIFFKRKNEDSDKRLRSGLRSLGASCLPSKSVKRAIKARLMSAVRDSADLKEYSNVILPIREIARSLVTPKELKMAMRRRVLNRISLDLGSFSWFQVVGKGICCRAVIAAVMIFVVSFVSIFTFQINTPVSYAKDNVLHNVEGDVYVYRTGMLIPAADGFVLLEGDKIHTGYGSSVTAIFMDGTVSRVAGESKLNLSKLFADEFTGGTQVTLGVAEGRIWSKVTSLISGSFNVATLHTVVKVQRNATFDVNVGAEDKVAISVVENFVDVELSSYSPAVTATIVEGESLIVDHGKNIIVGLDDRDAWLRMNKSKDEFESQLFAQIDVSNLEETVGALPTDTMYGIKTFKENLGVVLSISQREKLETQLIIAEKRLAEAEILLNKGLGGNAEKVLQEYKQIMLDITREYNSLIGIAEVEARLSAMIARDKRRYYTTLPGSSLYEVKQVVKEVEFLLANDRIRANQIALDNASDDLYQVFDLLKHGAETIAEVSISDYPIVVENTFIGLNSYYQVDKDDYIRIAFRTALSDLKTINALHDSFESMGTLDIASMRDRVIGVLDEYFAVFNADSSYDDLLAEFEILQNDDLDELVELSEFVGATDQNTATVDVALDKVTSAPSELRYSE